MAEIEAVTGLIELKDEFTSQIGLAEAALHQFSKSNQESLTATAEAAGLVTAAFVALAATTVELGKRGADVQNVENTLEHFTGSAQAAEETMAKLKATTLGTVGSFDLAKDAAHLLSAGVNLTADQFGVLGGAAEVLHKRGLGPTAELLNLVSDAMVTGRTRALTLALGTVDITGAEEKYAASLGVTKDQLSQVGIAEAKRQAIMELLTKTVKDAGTQQRDFGEQITAAKVFVENWVDELGKAIATSPALAAGMEAVGKAVKDAFGGDSKEAIKTVMEYIKQGAEVAINFGLGAVELARVVHTAWSVISAIILEVEGDVVHVAATVVDAGATIIKFAASLPGATQGMKDMAAQADDAKKFLDGMGESLDKDTAEAIKGVKGTSDFDKTLDSLGGTLLTVKDAIDAHAASVDVDNKTVDIAAKNAATMARLQQELAKQLVDRQKIEEGLWKIEAKSLQETEVLWNDYFKLRAEHGVDAAAAQKQAIQSWFADEVSKLDSSDRNWQNHYDALKAVADEKLKGIEVDWKALQDASIDTLQHQADVARNTYNEMIANASHFTREAMDAQRQKVEDTADAVRGLGADTKAAMAAAESATQAQTDKLKAQQKAAEDAAAANRALGSSFTYDLSTHEGIAQYRKGNPAAEISWSDDQIMAYIKKGGTLEGLIKTGVINPYAHFAAGGTVDIMTGEHGPEVVRVPLGSTVYPTGMNPAGGGDTFYTTVNVNGTPEQAAQKAANIIISGVKMRKRFGASQ